MPIKIFFCYAHKDEVLLKKLKIHLRSLEQGGLIEIWYDRNINAEKDWEQEISNQLNIAQIILLLVSPDFMASDYCYSIEMAQALKRHERGRARVIPIILSPVYWREAPFSRLLVLPRDGRPITSWRTRNEALVNVTEGIHKVVEELLKSQSENGEATSFEVYNWPSSEAISSSEIISV